jgi:DtxR family transcriptional regulator, Mn-dependent transcriptional regulator
MRPALEEILESMWCADEKGDHTITAIRELCPDTISQADLDVLEKRTLIERDGDEFSLTPAGREAARGVVRRHRLATVLFSTVLNLDAEKREAVACEVEHALLPEVEESICTLLGHPTENAEGKPIPPGRCCSVGQTTASAVVVNLTMLNPGERGRITYIKPKHHARFHRLSSFGLTPGTVVELHQKFPAFCIRYEGTEIALNKDVAEDIFVSRIEAV